MRIKPLSLIIAALISGAGLMPPAGATELPGNVRAVAQSLGITVASDGSFNFNGTLYLSLLPPGYSAAQPAAGDPQARSDGSIVWGDLQFAPVVQTPGEMPHLPDNLEPLPGNTLPSDLMPPAGFVGGGGVNIPAGVSVPPLTPSAMIQQMADAGVLPPGLVQFNSDGTVSVQGGASYLPFLPPETQQGRATSSSRRTLEFAANGAVTFPDGSTYAPMVSGSTAGGTTLPPDFTPPAGTNMPASVNLPLQFEIPSNVQILPGMTLPAGVVIPPGYNIPSGTQLPPGVSIPANATVAAGVTMPNGIMLPAGTQISTTALPQGTTILPNGSVVIPGTQIPAGVTPPATWTPPTGATRGSDGTYSLPPPPATGFPPPPMPLQVNADGSVVMASPGPGAPLPERAVVNADGTYTMPPPAFIGTVTGSGTIEQTGTGAGIPADFQPLVPMGTQLPGAGMIPTGGTAYIPPTGSGTMTDPATGGMLPPPGDTDGMLPPPGDTGGMLPPPG